MFLEETVLCFTVLRSEKKQNYGLSPLYYTYVCLCGKGEGTVEGVFATLALLSTKMDNARSLAGTVNQKRQQEREYESHIIGVRNVSCLNLAVCSSICQYCIQSSVSFAGPCIQSQGRSSTVWTCSCYP